ncbi:N-acetyldiaminopimelate deacetylase [Thalassobacillus sp. CUG 92003]|uniref:N-acetyldiaminopimelate deacetylase n=1 Tax=Thalassobacillus sp. CUG 92003 TaxID=2736641 RepID=UPI0015E677E8|nr:N-acetyldiaminopimelate deacetylase [Thalassobacillus sp. CUG 92003]
MKELNLIELRRALHQIPELGFEEHETHRFLMERIRELPQESLTVKTWKTGIFVHVKGRSPTKTIGYRTDIDGLPIQEKTDYSFQSNNKGKMHACGHDFHMTIALGALTKLAHEPADDDILFIFQPAEEGPGGAEPMLNSDIMQEWRPDIIFALHIAPELPVGRVSSKPGLLFANTSELFVDLTGKGGHAAYPHLTHDMVTAASYLVTHLQQIVARRVDPLDSAVLTVGKISGGTVQNIISEHARLEGTIRTMSQTSMQQVKQHIENVTHGIEIAHDCQATVEYGSNYYQVYNDATLVEQFRDLSAQVGAFYQEASAAMTGEDFGYMLKDIPGFMFWLGVESETGLHTATLMPDEQALSTGVDVVNHTLRNL